MIDLKGGTDIKTLCKDISEDILQDMVVKFVNYYYGCPCNT